MDQIGVAAGALVSEESRQRSIVDSERALLTRKRSLAMPALHDRETDLEIPRRAWDPWKETGKPRLLRRPLTDEERKVLQRRRDEIAPWIVPFHRKAELDDVAKSIGKMFDAFPSMAHRSDESAASKIADVVETLSSFPAWAIIRACDRIRTQGYVKSTPDGYVTERHWPPSDPEIVEKVRVEEKVYRTAHDSAVALLTAEVAP